MVRRDVAERKIARAGSWLDDAEEILSLGTEVLSNDPKSRDLACFYLLLAIQESVDLAAHAVADAGWSPPEDAGGVFDVLADHDVIDRTLADSMHAAVGLRTRIAHGYMSIDHARLHREAASGIQALRKYLVALAAFAGV